MHLVSLHMMTQVCKFAARVNPDGILYIIDSSQRIQRQIVMHLKAYRYTDGEKEFQAEVMVADKDSITSCVEVADFVVHPAGAQVRNRVLRKLIFRKDFQAVFHEVDPVYSDYTEILKAETKA